MSAIQFAGRLNALADPYAPPQTAQKPRLDLRDVVPDFSEFYSQNIGPYPKSQELASALAKDLGLDAAQIATTAGGDDALFQVIMAMLEPGKNLVVATPTFPMIERYAAIAGGEMRTVLWLDGEFPIEAFLAQINENTRIVLFVSPNNPTGRTVPFETMQTVQRAAQHAVMILDAVYIEYATHDITQEFLNLPNSLVVRSFSKAYGAAGLRLGYAMSKTPPLLTAMRKIAQPYSISALSLEMGLQLLRQKPQVMAAVEKVKANRAILYNELLRQGWQVMPPEANFVFINCGNPDAARNLFQQMDARGIAIRFFPDDPLIAGYVRIGVPYKDVDLDYLISVLVEIKL